MQNQRNFEPQIASTGNSASLPSLTREIATGMVFLLADGTIQSCNPAAETILGFTLAQMQSSTSLDCLWQTIQEDGLTFPGETHPVMVALRTGQPVTGVVMGIYQPNDNLVWIKIDAVPLFDIHSPTPCAVVATFEDITEQKRTQSLPASPRLRHPQSLNRTVLMVEDCAEDREMYRRYLLRDQEHSYRILEAATGAAGLELCRTTQLDIVLLDYGLPDYEGLEFLTALQIELGSNSPPVIVMTGQGNETIAVQIMKAGAQDYLIKGKLTAHELQFAIISALKSAELKAALQQSAENERLLTQVTRYTEKCLRESQEQLQLGVQVAGVALAKFDYTSNTVELSPEAAALYGLPADELVVSRSRFHATFHPEESGQLLQMIEQVLDPMGAGCFTGDHRVVWETGVVRWLTVRKQVFFEGLGASTRPTHAILAAIDITDRKQAELEREHLLQQEQAARTEAERANRIKDEFLAVLSHELRSPLNPILGWTSLLRRGRLDAKRTQEALATIQRNAELQAQLIDDLLDISRIIQGKLILKEAPVSLTFVIVAAQETVSLAAQARNIQFTLTLPEKPIQVFGDAGRLQQVVWNLLSNAVKFTPSEGQVDVQLTIVGTQAQIQVVDMGKGIKPEFLPYVFDHFCQEDGATTRRFGGLGLGLAIARQIVEMHGGNIWVESPGENQGSTFTVQLPLLRSENPQSQSHDSPMTQSDTASLAHIRALIVDDSPDTCYFLEFLLEDSGASVTTTTSATAALQALEKDRFDILLSDISMPDIDGYMLIRAIRERTSLPNHQIPAIALTAHAGEVDQQQAIAAGFQRHLAKPINPDEVITLIMELVRYA